MLLIMWWGFPYRFLGENGPAMEEGSESVANVVESHKGALLREACGLARER